MSTNLVPLGPLTTLWTPPASCLSTTTQWGQLGQTGALFIGYHSDLGPDADCFPSHRAEPTGSPVTTALIAFSTVTGPTPTPIPSIVGFTTITPTPTGPFKADPLFSQTGYTSKVAYYSPGICPSGYTYAATYTGWEKYYIFRTPLPTSSVTQHFCCPSGYRPNLRITSSVKGGAFRDYTTTWPSLDYLLCSATPTSVANVWTMTPGWPTVKPTSYSLGNVEYDGLHAVRVWASGVIVGYQSTDTAVLDYLHQNNITLQTHLGYWSSSRVNGGHVAGLVLGVLFLLLAILWCWKCCCKPRRKAKLKDANSGASDSYSLVDHYGMPPSFDHSATSSSTALAGIAADSSNMATPNLVALGPVGKSKINADSVQDHDPPPPKYEP